MPFRTRQRFVPDAAFTGTYERYKINPDNGFVETVIEPMNKALPPVTMYDFTSCLKAGVNLDKVNTKILDDSAVLVADAAKTANNSTTTESTTTPTEKEK